MKAAATRLPSETKKPNVLQTAAVLIVSSPMFCLANQAIVTPIGQHIFSPVPIRTTSGCRSSITDSVLGLSW